MPTNISYVANGLNQYTSTNAGAAPVTYGYDANGNLSSDGATTYGYDTENRMVTAASASGTVTMRYDPLGRLYEVTAANGNKRRLYYSGDALIAEYDGAGTMLNRYVHGLSGGDDPLVQFNGASVALADAYFLSSDPRGSIVLISRQNGATPTINSYDEYGVPGTSNTGRFQYTGQAWVPELGMFYYKARMYSPTLGRFMQTDPIGYGDGMNMYAYVGGDPVNGVDPTGLKKGGGCEQDRTCPPSSCPDPESCIIVEGQRYDINIPGTTIITDVDGLLRRLDTGVNLTPVGQNDGTGPGGADGDPCTVESTSDTVHIRATIVGAGPASVIYGTITDPATHAYVHFTSGPGLSGITGAGQIEFSGLMEGGINVLSRGITVAGYEWHAGIQIGRANIDVGFGNGSITLSNYSGREIGKFDVNFDGATLGIGNKGVGIGGALFAADYGQIHYIIPGC